MIRVYIYSNMFRMTSVIPQVYKRTHSRCMRLVTVILVSAYRGLCHEIIHTTHGQNGSMLSYYTAK